MSWFNTFTSNVKNFLNIENPNKVLDVEAQAYIHVNIHSREDSLVLYGPFGGQSSDKSGNYELVLHRPFNESLTEAYSICRCSEFEIAQKKFLLFKDKLPAIVSACKELYNSTQIQKICDTIIDHPTWNIAHLATVLGQADVFSDKRIARFINVQEEQSGISPLQLAIQYQNIKMVQALLNKNASLDHLDSDNNSVLHHAASTNKQILQLLCEKSKSTLNSRNITGRTPLHMACAADKRECVHVLLEAGADVNISVSERRSSLKTPGCVGSIENFPKKLHGDDIKHGGTPLHWACSREVIQALVSNNCDINSLNFDQRTALHVMVLRNRLDCLVTLLSLKADCNIGDKDGNTPLHLAVKEGNEACVKTLLIFGADMTCVNNSGHLPRHGIPCDTEPGSKILYILHSIGAPRCPAYETTCNLGCKHDETYNGVMPPPPLSAGNRDLLDSLLSMNRSDPIGRKKGRVLSLDGGGIRGLILIVMLMELEKYVNRPIYECFDWIAGTSTGGILALAVASKKSLFDCLCLYFKLKDMAFCGKRPYATETFENILRETFGDKTTMADIKEPKLMITSTLVDRLPVDLHLFRNYQSPSEILSIPHCEPFLKPPLASEHFLWQTARATGAAPTYFRSFGRFLDGGLISNNPTLDALTEIEEHNAALKAIGKEDEVYPVSLVVSLGTGVIPVRLLTNEVDVFRPSSLWDASKFVFGVSTMGIILTDQATQAEGRVVDRARSWCSSTNIPFHRFSPPISENIEMDTTCNLKLTNMLWETMVYMHSRSHELKELANIIKELD
ncbi:hypothetical protein RUM43_001776 [Polyplax serrata]|uniref:phospholipase A2 n=1 Tax=Polyplax serrata TaxID=468196 RepID=A0AAN8SG11_POLSC